MGTLNLRRRLRRTAFGALVALSTLFSQQAYAADWLFVGYLLPQTGHPCVNDPYIQAGYVWIRKDANTQSNLESLKAAVKAENPKASLESPKLVKPGKRNFLIKKSYRCTDNNAKVHLETNYDFHTDDDEAALRKYMESYMRTQPAVLDYTFEDVTRSPQELDAKGTATVVGRSK